MGYGHPVIMHGIPWNGISIQSLDEQKRYTYYCYCYYCYPLLDGWETLSSSLAPH